MQLAHRADRLFPIGGHDGRLLDLKGGPVAEFADSDADRFFVIDNDCAVHIKIPPFWTIMVMKSHKARAACRIS